MPSSAIRIPSSLPTKAVSFNSRVEDTPYTHPTEDATSGGCSLLNETQLICICQFLFFIFFIAEIKNIQNSTKYTIST